MLYSNDLFLKHRYSEIPVCTNICVCMRIIIMALFIIANNFEVIQKYTNNVKTLRMKCCTVVRKSRIDLYVLKWRSLWDIGREQRKLQSNT